MKYHIKTHSDGVTIEVSELKGEVEQLLEAFQKCQEGRCTCPADEYSKLKSLEVEQAEGMINLRLKAKERREFDKAEIEKCLNHTDAQITPSG